MTTTSGRRQTRVLMEGTYTYQRRIQQGSWETTTETARVFILEWYRGGSWSGPGNESGEYTLAVVVFQEEAWLGERIDPVPVGSIREVQASGHGSDALVADVRR